MSAQIVSMAMAGRVAVITISNPPVNTINRSVRDGLRAVLAGLRARDDVAAVILVCDGNTFCSGADIGEFDGPPMEADYRELFLALENLAVPVVVGIHGTVMGGGLEIALACHYRIAAAGTRFGLPEVSLGIIPGAGGTQRLPRLIGIEKSLDLVLSGRLVDVATGISLGILDAVADGTVRDATLAYAQALIAKGTTPRRTSERSVDPSTGTPEILARVEADARRKFPNRTAPFTAIEAIAASARLPFLQGLLLEDQLVNRAKATVEAKALVHLFFAERGTRKIPGLPDDSPARPIRSAGIVGAGTMGGGIAMCFANVGIPVTIVDASADALARGLGVVQKNYQSMVDRGRLTPDEQVKRVALIRGSLAYDDLADADVIIEAVFEDMALKRKIFAELDRVAKPGAVFATNTSTLDVAEIAAATKRPQDVLGLHFFSPANVMPLLEVVRTDTTAADVIRTALDLAKKLKKTPVLARVCYGFIGNRMMEGYAREAERMVLEGATPRIVDGALERWGMAMGILAVFDMAGVDVGVNIHKAHADRYPPDPTYYQADFALHAAGRFGQKVGKGYYKYVAGDRARHDDPEAIAILQETSRRLGVAPRSHTEEEIVERCLYPLINEGLRILEEGVALRPDDIDVVWGAGYGFPRYRGGPMFYADTLGLPRILDGLIRYGNLFGPMHWQPARLLVQLVESKQTLAEWSAGRGA